MPRKALAGNTHGGPEYFIFDTASGVCRLQEFALWISDLVLMSSALNWAQVRRIPILLWEDAP